MTDQIKLSMLINDGESDQPAEKTPESIDTPTMKNSVDSDIINDNTENPTKKAKPRGRKKILPGPPYYCQFPGCNKTFQRSEHLSRHKLNHNPKKIFNCDFSGCGKTFVRHDLLIRHKKRHENKIQKKKLEIKPSEFLKTVVSNTMIENNKINEQSFNNNKNNNPTTVKEIVQQYRYNDNDSDLSTKNPEIPNISNTEKSTMSMGYKTNINSISNNLNINPTPNLFNWLFPEPNSNSILNSNFNDIQQHSNPENYLTQSNTNNNMQLDKFVNENNINVSQNSDFNNNNNHNNVNSSNNNDDNTFSVDLAEFNMNNDSHNFFIVQDDFSPSSSSTTGYLNQVQDNKSNCNNKSNNNNNNFDINSRKKNEISLNSRNNNLKSFQQSQGIQENEKITTFQIDDDLLCTLKIEQMKEFEILIPELKGHIDFTKLKFEKALKTYWNFFHPRFPMLHRPSFDSTNSPSLLLLSMIIIGSKLFMCVDNITCPDDKKLKQPKLLADIISEPLRWLLFASPFFQPPVEVWIIQSLLMLEFYEKHCSSRKLHERAHLHHGTTIQLLRRSPTLGGASTKDTNNEETDNWYKWIEIESMKRATFMCFYMDAIDAICLGHQMFIYSHQIQMTMPVEDSVWESNFGQFNNNFKNAERPRQFLIVLRDIMNGKPTKTNSFGKKILLAGLSAILFQIQQRDLQLFFGLDKFSNSISKNWRDLLTAAFAIWRNDVGNSCCSSKTAIDNLNSLGNSSQFSTSDTRCKCIAYHLAHIYMSISHYDIFIICGAPWRMNVKPSSILERNSIKIRVIEWSKTRHCEISIVQCYLCLFEMFLSPQDSTYEYQYDYLPDADLFFRSYMIGYILLVIWSYLFSKNKFKNIKIENEENQNGYLYLKNIRNQFTLKSKGILLHTWFDNSSGAEFYGNLMRWVNILNDIENLENIIGLLDMVGNKLINADYTVVRELGKLLLFCKDRSLGSTDKEILDDMYHTGQI